MPYIPIVKDRVFLDYDLDAPSVIIHASHILWRPTVLPAVAEKYPVIIDIETNRLVTNDANKSENFKELPYALDDSDFPKIFSDSTFRLQQLVEPAVKFQVDNGSSLLLAPYLMTNDWRSRTFSVNLELIADVINHTQHHPVDIPLLGVINISCDILRSVEGTTYVKDRYLEFAEHLDGYIIIADDFIERDADSNCLINFARLVHGLVTAGKKVYVFPIGSFGLILNAIGAEHYGSGIFGKETSSVAMFDSEGGFNRTNDWIYEPNIFTYVNAIALAKSGYTCDCAACNGGVASTLALKKKHDALVRKRLADELTGIEPEDRLAFIKSKLESGIRLFRQYGQAGFGPKSSYYLEKWLSVVDAAMSWPKTVEEDDELLDALLSEIDQD